MAFTATVRPAFTVRRGTHWNSLAMTGRARRATRPTSSLFGAAGAPPTATALRKRGRFLGGLALRLLGKSRAGKS
jgi:hypothetical protein